MEKKLGFGIIGCSRIAESSLIPAIINSEYAELVHIGSRDAKKAETFASKFSCKKHGTYDEVLNDESVDVVYISLPIGLHAEWSIKAAKMGKHVLCEKSSTASYSSALQMVESAKQNRVRLMEGLMFRFHPSHSKVLELVSDGSLGNICAFYGRYGFASVPKNDIRYKKELGGGVLNDAGCYPICASRIIFNKEPMVVSCHLHMDEEFGIDDGAMIQFTYGNNEFAQMVVGYGLFYQSVYSVWGTEGFLSLSRAYNIPSDMEASLVLNSDKKNSEIRISPVNHFVLMVDGFCKEILNISSASFNFEDELLKQAKVMEAARISNKEKRQVQLTEINWI
ncbi:gfo/Idh/MocA family oxidoreductase [Candidatus Parcubacteria bacterium]|nr:MAG: gfo/Idh/MocA family oxidoreductase [Candidatus Parcubacteria bacterium]